MSRKLEPRPAIGRYPHDTLDSRQRGPRLLLRPADLFSIEASFVLFLVSGRYKMLPELRGFPVDFTVLFFATTACLIAWTVASGRLRLRSPNLPVLLMVLFTGFVVVSLLWSSLEPLNTDKALRFVVLTSTSFFAANLIAQTPQRRDRFLRLLAWISFALVLYYCYYRFVVGIDITLFAGKPGYDNYLEYGDHAAILFITFLALAVFGSTKQLCVAVVGCGAALYLLTVIGGRGPLAFAILAVPLLGVGLTLRARGSLGRLTRLAILLSLLATCGGIGLLAAASVNGSRPDLSQFKTLNRYQMDLSYEDTISLDERARGRALAFDQWLQKPLIGWGIGEFWVEDNWLKYPHNMLLEVLMEMGIVGAFLIMSTASIAVANCLRIARDPSTGWGATVVALLFLTQLASHLTVENFLAEDRIFLAYMGLAIGSRIRRSRVWQQSSAQSRLAGWTGSRDPGAHRPAMRHAP